MRRGIGYDSHRFAPGRRLILAGVEIPYEWGLIGHSDADAAAHAITDAILGAAALGDIGAHFPPTDDRWKDADSIDLLERAVRIVEEGGYRVVNVDLTIICEVPRVLPYVPAMRERLAAAIGIGVDRVSVKGKTNEGMGWIGRGEGIAVQAVALLENAGG
jgi:2-C-methyl-D-erythritol 2,4-cyclodiphosphate synthase